MKKIVVILVVTIFLSGCSVYMAAHQPDKKNLDLLKIGADRTVLLAELGKPESSEIKDGQKVDLFRFVQGYSQGAKTGRAIFHGFADLMTIGLWEVIGTPAESALDGTETLCRITYDENEKAEKIVLIQGDKDPVVIVSGDYEEEWLRRQEMKVATILAKRLEEFDADSDNFDQLEQTDIPAGYSVLIGASFISSMQPYGVLPSVKAGEGVERYTSSTVFKHLESGMKFVLAGPRMHVYLVPAGNYEITSVSAEMYSDAELKNAHLDNTDTGEKMKGAAGLLFAFNDVAGKVIDTAYAPVSSLAGEKSRMSWKIWNKDAPSTFSALTLDEGEVAYIGHIQTHSFDDYRLEVDCSVFDEFTETRSSLELKEKYPGYLAQLSKKLIQIQQ